MTIHYHSDAAVIVLDAIGDLAYLVGHYGIDHRPVDGLSRLHDEFVSGLDLIVGRFDPAAGPRGHQVAPVSADALYEAAALAAEGFKGDAHRRITRGVPIPTDLRLLADTADLVYDLTKEYFSHPDVVSGAHSAIIGL